MPPSLWIHCCSKAGWEGPCGLGVEAMSDLLLRHRAIQTDLSDAQAGAGVTEPIRTAGPYIDARLSPPF